MKLYAAAMAIALALSGCGGGDTQAPPVRDGVEASPDIPVMGRERRILVIGDSLVAGFGLERGEAYPERLEAALRARGINARVVNAGVSGDTTAGGRQRLAFVLDGQSPPPELVVIELGANDMLRALPPAQARANLDAMLAEVRRRGMTPVLMGMLASANLGRDYRAEFDPIFPALARRHDAALVPFFLQPVIGKAEYLLPDKLHPSARGVEAMVAATVDTVAGALPKE